MAKRILDYHKFFVYSLPFEGGKELLEERGGDQIGQRMWRELVEKDTIGNYLTTLSLSLRKL